VKTLEGMEVIYATYTSDTCGNAIHVAKLMHPGKIECTEESLLSPMKANLFAMRRISGNSSTSFPDSIVFISVFHELAVPKKALKAPVAACLLGETGL
jgi:hypothetical protein